MSYRSYGSNYSPSYSSSLRRPYSSSIYSSSLNPLLYRSSTYSPSYSSATSAYRRPSFGSSSAFNKGTGTYGDSSEQSLFERRSSGSFRSLPRPEFDSSLTLHKTRFSHSLGNLSASDNRDGSDTDQCKINEDHTDEPNYKKLYEEESSQRELDEAVLIAELKNQIDLRDRLIELLSELEGLEEDLDYTNEMCELLERLQRVQQENERLKQQTSLKTPRTFNGRRF